jgi:predicted P-loop ATPase/GTPase
MISEDYSNIKTIIDDIIGIETQQGNNLLKAIKKYFEEKTISVKLINSDIRNSNNYKLPENASKLYSIDKRIYEEANKVLSEKAEQIKTFSDNLKKKGKFKGVCSISGD